MVQVGSDINLTCRAEESPEAPAAVVWYKNEERVDNLLARSVLIYVYLFNLLSPNRDLFTCYQLLFLTFKRGGISVVTESRRRTSNLLVSKVNKKDAGNYTCVPSNARADSVMVHVIDGMFTVYKEKMVI